MTDIAESPAPQATRPPDVITGDAPASSHPPTPPAMDGVNLEGSSRFAKPPSWSFGDTPAPAAASPLTEPAQQPVVGIPAHHAPGEPPPRLHARTGRRRSPVLLAMLSPLTLGLATLGWHARVNREIRDFDPRMHARPGRSLFAVALPWLAGMGAALVGLAALLGDRMPAALHPHLGTTVAWMLVLAPLAIPYATLLFPLSLVATVMTAERARQAQEHAGITSDAQIRPLRLPLVLAVPLLGGFVYPAMLQSRLNRAWDMVESQRPRRA